MILLVPKAAVYGSDLRTWFEAMRIPTMGAAVLAFLAVPALGTAQGPALGDRAGVLIAVLVTG